MDSTIRRTGKQSAGGAWLISLCLPHLPWTGESVDTAPSKQTPCHAIGTRDCVTPDHVVIRLDGI